MAVNNDHEMTEIEAAVANIPMFDDGNTNYYNNSDVTSSSSNTSAENYHFGIESLQIEEYTTENQSAILGTLLSEYYQNKENNQDFEYYKTESPSTSLATLPSDWYSGTDDNQINGYLIQDASTCPETYSFDWYPIGETQVNDAISSEIEMAVANIPLSEGGYADGYTPVFATLTPVQTTTSMTGQQYLTNTVPELATLTPVQPIASTSREQNLSDMRAFFTASASRKRKREEIDYLLGVTAGKRRCLMPEKGNTNIFKKKLQLYQMEQHLERKRREINEEMDRFGDVYEDE